MTTDDLLAELGRAVADLRLAERDDPRVQAWLTRSGFTRRARDVAGGVGMARISPDRKRDTWAPDEAGDKVLVIPVWDGPACEFDAPHRHLAPLIDLVAWRPAEPHRLYRRTGDGAVVGIEGVSLALETGDPLRLFRSPADFVRHGGERGPDAFAAVLIDPAAAFCALEGIAEVICDDIGHAEEVRSLLTTQAPAIPRLSVPAACLEAAA